MPPENEVLELDDTENEIEEEGVEEGDEEETLTLDEEIEPSDDKEEDEEAEPSDKSDDDDESSDDDEAEADFEDYMKQIEEGGDDDDDEEDDPLEEPDPDEEPSDDEDSAREQLKNRFAELDAEEDDDDDIFSEEQLDDDALYTAMADIKDYRDWIRLAESEGEKMDMAFARQIVQNDVPPQMLAEQGIFNFADLIARMDELNEAVDPDAILVPKQGDEEGWKKFNKEVNNIPDEASEYPEEIFDNTFLEENEEGKQHLLNEFAKAGASVNVAQAMINILDSERQGVDAFAKEDFEKYRTEQDAKLEDEYGDDYENHLRENMRFLSQYPAGRELLKEFEDTKFFNSASWFNFLSEIRESGDVQRPKINMRSFQNTVSQLTDKSLTARYNALLDNKFLDPKYDGHENKEYAQKHARLYRAASVMQKEINKRGLK